MEEEGGGRQARTARPTSRQRRVGWGPPPVPSDPRCVYGRNHGDSRRAQPPRPTPRARRAPERACTYEYHDAQQQELVVGGVRQVRAGTGETPAPPRRRVQAPGRRQAAGHGRGVADDPAVFSFPQRKRCRAESCSIPRLEAEGQAGTRAPGMCVHAWARSETGRAGGGAEAYGDRLRACGPKQHKRGDLTG